jgi:proteasome lid subunit RPN8/RPN11
MIKIRRHDLENVLSHCNDENPIEACGIFAGTIKVSSESRIKEVLKVYHCTNALNSPTEYRIDAEEQFKVFSEIDAEEMDLLGFYHSHASHPYTSPKPSSIDRDRANYIGYSYMIVALHPTRVTSWILEKKGVFKKEEICIL